MGEIKALEKLRTAARNMAKGRNLENHEECNLLLIIADEIEAEIAERFMELPVDADGTLVKAGDTVYITRDMPLVGLDKKDVYVVRGIGLDLAWIVKKGGNALDTCVYTNELRHVKPRTLEDVLCDALADASCAGDGIRRKFEPDEPYVTKLADEIRELLGGAE